jgi:hypothetical protein
MEKYEVKNMLLLIKVALQSLHLKHNPHLEVNVKSTEKWVFLLKIFILLHKELILQLSG